MTSLVVRPRPHTVLCTSLHSARRYPRFCDPALPCPLYAPYTSLPRLHFRVNSAKRAARHTNLKAAEISKICPPPHTHTHSAGTYCPPPSTHRLSTLTILSVRLSLFSRRLRRLSFACYTGCGSLRPREGGTCTLFSLHDFLEPFFVIRAHYYSMGRRPGLFPHTPSFLLLPDLLSRGAAIISMSGSSILNPFYTERAVLPSRLLLFGSLYFTCHSTRFGYLRLTELHTPVSSRRCFMVCAFFKSRDLYNRYIALCPACVAVGLYSPRPGSFMSDVLCAFASIFIV